MHSRQEKIEALGRVIDTLDILRVECPWDRKQTNESLRPNTIEETYELCDALLNDDAANIRNMYRICGGDPEQKIHQLLDFTDMIGDVADPWYTGNFEATWIDVSEGCQCLLDQL